MIEKIFKFVKWWEGVLTNDIRKEQREFCKPHLLNKDDGSDWRNNRIW